MGNCCKKTEEEPEEIEAEPAPEKVEAEPEPEPVTEPEVEHEPSLAPEPLPEPEPPSDEEPVPVLEPEPVVSEAPPPKLEPQIGSFEIHTTDIMQHEMIVCGIPMKETKKLTKINIDSKPPHKEIMIHTKSIGDKEIEATNITSNGHLVDVIVDTACYIGLNHYGNSKTMSEEEINQFRRDRGKLWIPVLSKKISAIFSTYETRSSKKWLCPQRKFIMENFSKSKLLILNTFWTILNRFRTKMFFVKIFVWHFSKYMNPIF